ncbi:High-affinity glucose transporter rgt2 [Orbilia ellipsospora]|uniref:High-affinity glucose transporter rgt2 n=1 Tax=Orbilia ellipsospora TaxID=2528407 RepID=A0AAV9XN56_9PEZI
MDYWIKEFARNEDSNGNKYISSGDKSLIVSILSVGTFFGALMSAQVADFFGRKRGLMISSVVFAVGVVFQTAATEIIMLVVGRLIAGWGVGLLSAQVPMYQSETSPKWIRGAIVGSYQLAITIGLLLASCADQGTHNRQDTGSYRIPIAIQFAWALILFFGMMFLPETPRFLIKRNRLEDAAISLSTLRRLPADHPEVLTELNEIKANHEYEMSIGQTSYTDLLSNKSGFLRKRLLTGVGIQVFQQLSGANFIFYYGTTFFQSAGLKNSFIVSLISNCVNVVSALPGLWLVDNWGRRNLLLFGAAGMFVCQFVVHGLCYATPYMVDSGPGNANLGAKVFFVWGSFCAIGFLFVYTFIYETKGFTLEQVDEIYAKMPHAWKSPGFQPTVNFVDVAEEVQQQPYEGGRRPTLSEIEASAIRRKSSVGFVEREEK